MDPAALREDMVDSIKTKVTVDDAVALAMRTVEREPFVADIGHTDRDSEAIGTRVLAPSLVARLVSALNLNPSPQTQQHDTSGKSVDSTITSVLIVGAGVGYTAAIIAELVGGRSVHAVDIDREVVYEARKNLSTTGHDSVLVDARDGAQGFAEYAPYDRILIEAAAVDPPRALLEQLRTEGRLVLPLGGPKQTLTAVDHKGNTVDEFGPVAFNPLLVEGELGSGPPRNRTRREDAEYRDNGYFAKTGWEHEWIDWENQL
jgi:protein-L-isoaspartate(D-aspartate) O-methyltransferase